MRGGSFPSLERRQHNEKKRSGDQSTSMVRSFVTGNSTYRCGIVWQDHSADDASQRSHNSQKFEEVARPSGAPTLYLFHLSR